MAKITIVTFAKIKQIIGKKEFVFEAIEIKDLIKKLIDEFGSELKQELFDEKGEIRKNYRILVNARNINILNGTETELQENDRVVIMPAVAGG